jgi:hypothetical protein
MTGGERDQLVIVQQQLGEIRERVVALEVITTGMKETQDSNAGKIDILVDRVADNRLENYKNGLLAAAVAALVSAFGGSVR